MALEKAQLQMLEFIAEYGAKQERPQIEEDPTINILNYLIGLNYVEDTGDYWRLTEEGQRVLWENKRKLRQEKADAARSWISIGISAAALVVAIVALVLN